MNDNRRASWRWQICIVQLLAVSTLFCSLASAEKPQTDEGRASVNPSGYNKADGKTAKPDSLKKWNIMYEAAPSPAKMSPAPAASAAPALAPAIKADKSASSGSYMVVASVPKQPTSHVWRNFYDFNEVKAIYATYSYVLSGRSGRDRTESERYLKFIAAVKDQSTEHMSSQSQNYNVFLFPQLKGNASGEKPNYELSMNILDLLKSRTSYSYDMFGHPGPYIITLYHPIGLEQQGKIADILFLDLTGVNPEAFPTFISDYEKRLQDAPLSKGEKFRSFRTSLLKAALITKDCIGFTKVAYGDLLKLNPHSK